MVEGGITPREQLVLLNQLQISHLRPGLAVAPRRLAPEGLELHSCSRSIPLLGGNQGCDVRTVAPEGFLAQARRAGLLPAGPALASGLQQALDQRISRSRVEQAVLPEALQQALTAALARRFGEAATGGVELEGLYPDIPPEAAKSVRLAADFSQASFLPAAAEAGELRGGFWLVVVKSPAAKTDKFLLRLE